MRMMQTKWYFCGCLLETQVITVVFIDLLVTFIVTSSFTASMLLGKNHDRIAVFTAYRFLFVKTVIVLFPSLVAMWAKIRTRLIPHVLYNVISVLIFVAGFSVCLLSIRSLANDDFAKTPLKIERDLLYRHDRRSSSAFDIWSEGSNMYAAVDSATYYTSTLIQICNIVFVNLLFSAYVIFAAQDYDKILHEEFENISSPDNRFCVIPRDSADINESSACGRSHLPHSLRLPYAQFLACKAIKLETIDPCYVLSV